jgi:hypothetical protein
MAKYKLLKDLRAGDLLETSLGAGITEEVKDEGKPEMHQVYWTVSGDGQIVKLRWLGFFEDNCRWELSNVFLILEEAEQELERRKLYAELKRVAKRLNGDWEVDRNNRDQTKYFICYDHYYRRLDIDWCATQVDINLVYFAKHVLAEQAIKEIGEDRLKVLFN